MHYCGPKSGTPLRVIRPAPRCHPMLRLSGRAGHGSDSGLPCQDDCYPGVLQSAKPFPEQNHRHPSPPGRHPRERGDGQCEQRDRCAALPRSALNSQYGLIWSHCVDPFLLPPSRPIARLPAGAMPTPYYCGLASLPPEHPP
ncbi:hypothetical protein SDC9_190774 [bioreactor metagenome]|uniref:Uncharacterized protein n=1 Tax=bioreactor metagenome TaxID=1076179 RepID=A0A645HVY2_9ZZZZ